MGYSPFASYCDPRVLPSFLVSAFATDSRVLGMTVKNPYNRPCCFHSVTRRASDPLRIQDPFLISLAACHQGRPSCADVFHQIIALRHPTRPPDEPKISNHSPINYSIGSIRFNSRVTSSYLKSFSPPPMSGLKGLEYPSLLANTREHI